MSSNTPRLLLDANLSPLTREFLINTFGFDVVDLQSRGLGHLTDREVIELALAEQRIVVTLDLDFGEIYNQWPAANLGVLVLRLRDQTVESINHHLERFFTHQGGSIPLGRALVVLEEHRYRVRTG